MIDVKNNFKNGNIEDQWCKTCKLFPEKQEHLMKCHIIRNKLKGQADLNEVSYEFIFGDISQQEKLAKTYALILQARSEILKPSNEDQSTGGGHLLSSCCKTRDEEQLVQVS